MRRPSTVSRPGIRPSPTRRLGAATLVVLCLLGGCATNDQARTRGEGAAVGAAIGAAFGHVASGNNKARGAAMGALVGGLLGALAGDQVAAKKAAMVQREEQLLVVVAQAQQAAEQARASNAQLRQDIEQLESTRARLRDDLLSVQVRQQAALEHRDRTTSLMQQTEKALADVRGAIELQQAAIQAEQQQARPSENMRLVVAGVQELQVQERDLEQIQAQLRLIDSRRAY